MPAQKQREKQLPQRLLGRFRGAVGRRVGSARADGVAGVAHWRNVLAKSSARCSSSVPPVNWVNSRSKVPALCEATSSSGAPSTSSLSAVDDDHPLADALDHVEDVRAVDDRFAFAGQGLDQRLEADRGVGVEPVERLVEKNDLGIVQQGRGDHHFPPHSLGIGPQQLFGQRLEAEIEKRDELADALAGRQRAECRTRRRPSPNIPAR